MFEVPLRVLGTARRILREQGVRGLLLAIIQRFFPGLAVSRLRCYSQYLNLTLLRGEQVEVVPAIRDRETLFDVLSRVCWFTAGMPVRRCRFHLASPALLDELDDFVLPDGFDERVLKLMPAFLDRCRFEIAGTAEPRPARRLGGLLLGHDKAFESVLGIGSGESYGWALGPRYWCVDPRHESREGANYTSAAFHLSPHESQLLEASRQAFGCLRERLGPRRRCNVIATGPSFSVWPRLDCEDALSIVCNSAIANEALMRTVKPEILVFADPIFHFGPSEYAAQFRRTLRDAAARYDFTIVMPFKYLGLFHASCPDLAHRTIGIPFVELPAFNTDVCSDFRVKVTANILTLLMLPLATTLADEVVVIGCDGRPLSEDGYFWRHNSDAQFDDKMAGIRAVHPAFFDISYNGYYQLHCDLTEQFCKQAENAGKRVYCAAPSYIPALGQREDDTVLLPAPVATGSASTAADTAQPLPRVLVVDPTRIGSACATGQLKQVYFDGYPPDRLLQIYQDRSCLGIAGGAELAGSGPLRCPSMKHIVRTVREFAPEVIYFRPTGDERMDTLLASLMAAWPARLVLHVMDDWLLRMHELGSAAFQGAERRFRHLLSAADARLAISQAMATAFRQRYGFDYAVLANGVSLDAIAAGPRSAQGDLKIRYMGGLEEDMTLQSILDVAAAVDGLGELPVELEIFTSESHIRRVGGRFPDSERVRLRPYTATMDEYWANLHGADILLIAYNFDVVSQAYTRYSFANKLPECLASGAAIFGYGPEPNASLDFLQAQGVAQVLRRRDPGLLQERLRQLCIDAELRRSLAARALELARQSFGRDQVLDRFHAVLQGSDGTAAEADAAAAPPSERRVGA